MVVAGRIDIANLDASYLNFVSSTGQLLTSTPLSSSQCMPALDTSMTRYEADATTYRVRATRRDGTVAWQTSVPEYFIGTSSTMLLGNTTVAATLLPLSLALIKLLVLNNGQFAPRQSRPSRCRRLMHCGPSLARSD